MEEANNILDSYVAISAGISLVSEKWIFCKIEETGESGDEREKGAAKWDRKNNKNI